MKYNIEEVSGDDLPGDATHGFKIINGDGNVGLFFHWHEAGEIEVEQLDRDEFITMKHPRTAYSEVLKALPQRLHELGVNDADAAALMGEVVGRYGAGD